MIQTRQMYDADQGPINAYSIWAGPFRLGEARPNQGADTPWVATTPMSTGAQFAGNSVDDVAQQLAMTLCAALECSCGGLCDDRPIRRD